MFAVPLALSLGAVAQQPYAPSPYGNYSPYANQYAQPIPQYTYPNSQYSAPQSAAPQYQQPQYSAPQQYPDQQQYAGEPYANQPYPSEQDLTPPPAAPLQPLSADQLEQLLAPIALYPDALLAQILAASTYPAQIPAAGQWLQPMRAQGYGSPDQIASGANAQTTWDPSIKALTAFPDVLDMLNHNLEWTTALGNAYYNQPQDVMQTVQVLRQRAEQAGNLQSTPQETVTNDQGYVDIAPPNAEQVYVPTYDPWDVYGQPVSPYPGFSLFGALGDFFGSSPIQYGLSFALGAFGHTPFGLLAWGLDWFANSVLFNHGAWVSHSTELADWGLPHGGPRAFPGWHSPARGPGDFNHGYGRSYAYSQRGNWSNGGRPGNFVRPANGVPFDPRSNEFNRGAQQFTPQRGNEAFNRPPDRFNQNPQQFNRGPDNFSRGVQSPRNSFSNPATPARPSYDRATSQPGYAYRPQTFGNSTGGYNYSNHPQTYPGRPPVYASRPQVSAFNNPGYGYGNRSAHTYSPRPNYAYSSPYSSYRTPRFSQPSSHDDRSFNPYGDKTARSEHSGGFHLFGGGSSPKSFKAPKYSAPRSFGGFSHGKASSAPKASHSGGGGGGHRHR